MKGHITAAQRRYMARAFDLVLRFPADNCCGVSPGAPGYRTCRALEKRGLMRFMGYCADIDGECERERGTYSVTPLGAELLLSLKEIEAAALARWHENYARLLCKFDPPLVREEFSA